MNPYTKLVTQKLEEKHPTQTFKRKCISNFEKSFEDSKGKVYHCKVKKGKKYITSKVINEHVLAFVKVKWFVLPSDLFEEGRIIT